MIYPSPVKPMLVILLYTFLIKTNSIFLNFFVPTWTQLNLL